MASGAAFSGSQGGEYLGRQAENRGRGRRQGVRTRTMEKAKGQVLNHYYLRTWPACLPSIRYHTVPSMLSLPVQLADGDEAMTVGCLRVRVPCANVCVYVRRRRLRSFRLGGGGGGEWRQQFHISFAPVSGCASITERHEAAIYDFLILACSHLHMIDPMEHFSGEITLRETRSRATTADQARVRKHLHRRRRRNRVHRFSKPAR